MRRALPGLFLVAAVAVAFGSDDPDPRTIEHEVASVDTSVRAAAFERAEKLKNSSQKVRLLCKAAEDPDPEIQKRARDRLLHLDPRDARHLRPDRLAGPLLHATSEEDQLQLLQIIENGLDSGARFPPGPLLSIAVKAKAKELRARVLKAALVAVDIAPIVSADLHPLGRLMADPETRETALDLVCRSDGPTATRLLVELEATSGAGEAERAKVTAALDARSALEEFPAMLEEIARTTTDERVREAVKKRLAKK